MQNKTYLTRAWFTTFWKWENCIFRHGIASVPIPFAWHAGLLNSCDPFLSEMWSLNFYFECRIKKITHDNNCVIGITVTNVDASGCHTHKFD